MGKGKRDEVGRLGCVGIKEVGEESGRVDDEGKPILERVDLMEALFTVRSKKSCM